MKAVFSLIAVGLVSMMGLLPAGSAESRPSKRKTIAVMFVGASGAAVANQIISELTKAGSCAVIDRQSLTFILKEQNLQASGITESDVTSIGKLKNWDYVCFGNVGSVEKKGLLGGTTITTGVSARLTNLTTGEIERTFEEAGDGSEVAKRIAAGITEHVAAIRCRIIDVDKDEMCVTINRGAADGITVGRCFRYMPVKKSIEDPDTGKKIVIYDEKQAFVLMVCAIQENVSILKYAEERKKEVFGRGSAREGFDQREKDGFAKLKEGDELKSFLGADPKTMYCREKKTK